MPPKKTKTAKAQELENQLAEAPKVSDTDNSSSARERVLSALLVEALKKPKASPTQPTSVDARSSNSKPASSPRPPPPGRSWTKISHTHPHRTSALWSRNIR